MEYGFNSYGVSVPIIPTANYGLYAQTSLSTPIVNTINELNLIGLGVGTLEVPPNSFKIGDSFSVRMCGKLSCANNETLHIRIKSNGVALIDTGIFILNIATNKYWDLVLDFTITKIGGVGVAEIFANGCFSYNRNANTSFEGVNFAFIQNSVFDTTISNTLIITAQWGSAKIENSIYSQNFTLNKIY